MTKYTHTPTRTYTFAVPAGCAAVEGVMIGRAAYNDPWGVLGNADRAVFGADCNAATSRRQVCRHVACVCVCVRVRVCVFV
jgi:tRNA-dihydrouridine synthase